MTLSYQIIQRAAIYDNRNVLVKEQRLSECPSVKGSCTTIVTLQAYTLKHWVHPLQTYNAAHQLRGSYSEAGAGTLA